MDRITRCVLSLGVLSVLVFASALQADDMAMLDGVGHRPDAAPPTIRATPVRPPPDAVGNNSEALATARSLLHYLHNYLPGNLAVGGLKANLRLEADDEAEQQLDSDGDTTAYRDAVRIAYLVVYIPAQAWRPASTEARRRAAVLSFPLLRSLYPHASLYMTIFDGQAPVANANWKAGLSGPVAEVE